VQAFLHDEPRHAAVGIRHHPGAAAISAQETTVSLRWKASLKPAATMGTHTSSKNMPISNAESAAASRAYTPMITDTPAAMRALPVKYARN